MHNDNPQIPCSDVFVENIFDVLETVAMRLRNTRAARGIRGRRGGSHCAAPLDRYAQQRSRGLVRGVRCDPR